MSKTSRDQSQTPHFLYTAKQRNKMSNHVILAMTKVISFQFTDCMIFLQLPDSEGHQYLKRYHRLRQEALGVLVPCCCQVRKVSLVLQSRYQHTFKLLRHQISLNKPAHYITINLKHYSMDVWASFFYNICPYTIIRNWNIIINI